MMSDVEDFFFLLQVSNCRTRPEPDTNQREEATQTNYFESAKPTGILRRSKPLRSKHRQRLAGPREIQETKGEQVSMKTSTCKRETCPQVRNARPNVGLVGDSISIACGLLGSIQRASKNQQLVRERESVLKKTLEQENLISQERKSGSPGERTRSAAALIVRIFFGAKKEKKIQFLNAERAAPK